MVRLDTRPFGRGEAAGWRRLDRWRCVRGGHSRAVDVAACPRPERGARVERVVERCTGESDAGEPCVVSRHVVATQRIPPLRAFPRTLAGFPCLISGHKKACLKKAGRSVSPLTPRSPQATNWRVKDRCPRLCRRPWHLY